MQPTLIQTADGSHSLYLKELDEHYHSIHGAIQEGKHVFIETGLKKIPLPYHKTEEGKSTIDILEIGLGTGLNAFLTYLERANITAQINYTALEAYPLNSEIIAQLNYLELLSAKQHQTLFNKIHECSWEQLNQLDVNFYIHKIKNTLQQVVFSKQFDIIYFDAFGPRVQPEMWTEDIFTKIYSATKPNGFIVTYCAKGEVKRTLKKVGFTVESLPGPPRKREMVRATKIKE
jgi:tRNA U34 5-methylaminomethyl-2-thiouridine-forming methyltransferase MnmC